MSRILLVKVSDRHYDEEGRLYAYTMGDTVATFDNDPDGYTEYVNTHAEELGDVEPFTGSAGELATAKRILDRARGKR